MSSGSHIFISYARRDGRELADRLYQALVGQGWRAWRDERDLNPYQDFSVAIERAIRDSQQVVVLLTSEIAGREDSFVRREILEAQAREKPIIPLLGPGFDANDVPILIKHLTWLPFADFDAHLPALLERLANPPEGYAPPTLPDDPFRAYVEQLRDFVNSELEVSLLNIHDLILLQARDTPNVVQASAPAPLPTAFKSRAFRVNEIEPQPLSQRDFDNFNEGFAAHEGRVLLLGEPGAGKTTTLLAFTRQKAIDRLAHPANPLPVYAPLSSWDGKRDLVDWLANATGLNTAELQAEIAAKRALFILDGLDEMTAHWRDPDKLDEKPRDFRLELLTALKPVETSVLVACRINDYDDILIAGGKRINLNGAITLQPLSDEQIKVYLRDQPELYDALQADDVLLNMARTPLLLTLLAIGYRDSTQAERDNLRDLSTSPGDLRDRIFDTYITKRYEHEQDRSIELLPYSLEELTEKLGWAALVRWSDSYYLDSSLLTKKNFLESDQIPLTKLAVRLHLLQPVGTNIALWRWLHLLLRDYFSFRQAAIALDDDNRDIRIIGANVLGQIGDSRAAERLIGVLTDEYDSVRLRAANALEKLGIPYIVDPLIQALLVGDVVLQTSTERILKNSGYSYAMEPLIHALTDADVKVRNRAEVLLERLNDVRAIEPLITILADPNLEIRRIASRLLIAIGKPIVPPLLQCLADDDAIFRRNAACILGYVADVRAIVPLTLLLSDTTQIYTGERICNVAADALRMIGTPEAFEAVTQWRAEQNENNEE